MEVIAIDRGLGDSSDFAVLEKIGAVLRLGYGIGIYGAIICLLMEQESDGYVKEWAIYDLATNPEKQEHLYGEIQRVCDSEKIKEENVSQLLYLSATFQKTLWKPNPVPEFH